MDNLCKCGCGERIIKKPYHSWYGVPIYINGHNSILPKSELTKKRMSEASIGKSKSEKHKCNLKIAMNRPDVKKRHSEAVAKAQTKLWKDRNYREKHTEALTTAMNRTEVKAKLSEAAKKRIGEKAPRWLGGISKLPYSQDWTEDLKDCIRKRDNYTCQLCGIFQEELKGWNAKLDVHHIDYNKENCDPNNLKSLCHSCHSKTNGERDNWIKYFNLKVPLLEVA